MARNASGRQFRVLWRHFFSRLSYNELLKFEEQGRESRIVLLVLLAVAGLLLANAVYEPFLLFAIFDMGPADLWYHEAMLVAFSMAVAGVIAVASWDKLFLDRLDRINLRPLPVRAGTLFAAKTLGLLGFVVAVTLAGNFFPLLIASFYPERMLGSLIAGPAHLLAVLLGGLFVFLAVALLQGLVLTLAPPRWARSVAVLVQALLLVVFTLLLFGFPLVQRSLPELEAKAPALFRLFPPLWFTGVFNRLAGAGDPLLDRAGRIGLAALALVLAAYLLVARLCLRGFLAGAGDAAQGRRRPVRLRALRRRLAAVFLRHPLQRAVFSFFFQTLARSREHKLRLILFLAMPLGILLSQYAYWQWKLNPGPEFLATLPVALPLVTHLFLLLGLRMIVTYPFLLPANFVFRVSGNQELRHYQAGLRKALVAGAILAPLLVSLPLLLLFWPWRAAALHALFCLAVALLLQEACFFSFHRVPFAAEHLPGKLQLRYYWPVLLAGGYMYYSALTGLGLRLMRMPRHYPVFFLLAALVYALLRSNQRRRLAGERLAFEEEPEPAMMTLGFD